MTFDDYLEKVHGVNLGDGRPVGFIDVHANSFIATTGIANGPIFLNVEVASDLPDRPPGAWQESIETSIPNRGSDQFVVGTFDSFAADEKVLAKPPGAFVRVRFSATGRQTHYDLTVDEVTERYWIQLWGEDEPRPDVVSVLEPRGAPAPPLSPEAAAAKEKAASAAREKARAAAEEGGAPPAQRAPGGGPKRATSHRKHDR